jgi:hypothetical protein
MSGTPTIEASGADVIDERGPTALAELAAEMVRLGRTRARNPELSVASALRAHSGWYGLADGRWTTSRHAFRDVQFPHRLTADEVATGWIDPHPDFSPLMDLPEFPRPWRDGPGLGIPATLGELAPGAVVLASVDRGRLILSPAPEESVPAAAPAQVAAFAAAAHAALATHRPSAFDPGVRLADLLVSLASLEPAEFSGTVPFIADLVAAAGLEAREGQVAAPGTDWAARDRFMDSLRFGGADEPEDDYLDDGAGYWPDDEMPDSVFPRATDRVADPRPRPPAGAPVSLDGRRFGLRGRRPAKRCLQLRIRLLEVRPPVWRRILVPATITLDRLHGVVQEAMGWSDMHLHEFGRGRERWGDAEIEDDGGRLLDEFDVRLRSIVAAGDRLRYLYDLGDTWWHEIVIEGEVEGVPGERYPLCVDGAGACPPEDCGGLSGYQELLEALARPRSRRHRDLLRWLGGPFDPDEFAVEDVNARFDLLA